MFYDWLNRIREMGLEQSFKDFLFKLEDKIQCQILNDCALKIKSTNYCHPSRLNSKLKSILYI